MLQKIWIEIDSQRTDGTYGRYAGLDDKFAIRFCSQYIKFGLGRAFDASRDKKRSHYKKRD